MDWRRQSDTLRLPQDTHVYETRHAADVVLMGRETVFATGLS